MRFLGLAALRENPRGPCGGWRILEVALITSQEYKIQSLFFWGILKVDAVGHLCQHKGVNGEHFCH
jgi:hypothetical protein